MRPGSPPWSNGAAFQNRITSYIPAMNPLHPFCISILEDWHNPSSPLPSIALAEMGGITNNIANAVEIDLNGISPSQQCWSNLRVNNSWRD